MKKIVAICNPDVESYLDELELEDLIMDHENASLEVLGDFDLLLVQHELSWDLNGNSKSLNTGYGTKLIKHLRLVQRLKVPIVCFGFLPDREQIYVDRIVQGPQHRYLQIPFTSNELSDLESCLTELNEMQFEDVVFNFCNTKNSIDDVFHQLKGKIRQNIFAEKPNLGEALETIKSEFNTISQIAGHYPELDQELSQIKSQLDGNDKSSFEKFVSISGEQLTKHLPDNDHDKSEKTYETKPFEVLIMDDEPDSLNELVAKMQEYGFKTIHRPTNVKQAKEFIENDRENRISVVVSDFRIKEVIKSEKEVKEIISSEQGYDFLAWLRDQDRLQGMIALTGMSKRFLLHLFDKVNMNVVVKSKNDLSGTGINLFIETIEDLGYENKLAIETLPSSGGWNAYGLYRFYKYWRSHKEYRQIERNIQVEVKRRIEIVDEQLHFAKENRIRDFDNELFKGQIAHIDQSSGGTQTNFANKNPDKKEDFELFIELLVKRRLAIWLKEVEGMKPQAVAGVLFNGIMSKRDPKDTKQDFYKIGYSPKYDFPRNILVEEKNWLKYQMGLNPYRLEEYVLQIRFIFEDLIKEWIPKVQKSTKKEGLEKLTIELNSVENIVAVFNKIKRGLENKDQKNEFQSDFLLKVSSVFEDSKDQPLGKIMFAIMNKVNK